MGQLVPAAGPEGRAEGRQGGRATAAPRCNGDGGDGIAGSAGPSRAVQLQEDKLRLLCARHSRGRDSLALCCRLEPGLVTGLSCGSVVLRIPPSTYLRFPSSG
jgi:hypothetical protein